MQTNKLRTALWLLNTLLCGILVYQFMTALSAPAGKQMYPSKTDLQQQQGVPIRRAATMRPSYGYGAWLPSAVPVAEEEAT